jgi:penicillin-binding protein 1B
MVGGRNYGASQFNRVTQAERQPGSAFKPFIFLAALDQGFTPTSRLSNVLKTYEVNGKKWQPRNFAPLEKENISLRMALARSVNLATIDLLMKVGMEEVVRSTLNFRFSTPLKPLPSIALGTMEVIPIELARAYCVFAADGMLPNLLSVKDIVDEEGGILDRMHMSINRVTTPAKAFIMSSLLKNVVVDGTAQALRGFGLSQPIAGKTGTTDNSRDAWFIGYTPDLLTLVWIGFDDGASIHGTGSSAALPIWADLMKNIPQHLSGTWFRTPPGVLKKEVCAETGQPAVPGGCPNTYVEDFLMDHVPTESCRQHSAENFFRRVFTYVEEIFKKN